MSDATVDAAEMTNQVTVVIDKLNEVGTNIAEGVKPLAETIVMEYSRAHMVSLICFGFIFLVGLIFTIVGLRKTTKFWKRSIEISKDSSFSESEEGMMVFSTAMTTALSVAGIIAMAVSCALSILAAQRMVSPTYFLLKDLLAG